MEMALMATIQGPEPAASFPPQTEILVDINIEESARPVE